MLLYRGVLCNVWIGITIIIIAQILASSLDSVVNGFAILAREEQPDSHKVALVRHELTIVKVA